MENQANQVQFEFKLSGIELLEFSIKYHENIIKDLKIFHYNLNLEHRFIEDRKLVVVTISVEVIHEDHQTVLASFKASCIFEILNFEKIIVNQDNRLLLQPETVLIVNSISISTVRGIMFALFRGTYLHNAILPVIDPKKLTQNPL
jgi:hypothetical protein